MTLQLSSRPNYYLNFKTASIVMKILFATLPQPKNRFVVDLQSGIENYAEVVHDYKEFWACENHYDIIHIHEPEYLSFEIEACMYNTDTIPTELWNRLMGCLEHWSKTATIIHTRHVQEPHVRIDDEFRKLYNTVFSYCNGMAHFASFSIQQFKDFYPDLKQITHKVIPHHNYTSMPNTTTREVARKKMEIRQDAKVMLVFGMIKEREKEVIKTAFEAIPGTNKVLLAPGWKIPKPNIKWIRLREWVHKYQIKQAAKNKVFRINIGQGILTSFRDLIGIFCEFAGYNPEIKPLLDKPVGVHSRYCDMTWVKENLGWEPKISIKEGMKRVYDAVIQREKQLGNF